MNSSRASSCNGYSSGMVAAHRIKEISASSDARRRRLIVSYNTPLCSRQGNMNNFYWSLTTQIVAITRFRKETYRVFGVLELQLSGKYTGQSKEYLAGSGKGKFSIADIGTWPWVKNWAGSGFTDEEMGEFPHLIKWIERIGERPAVKRGIGEKYKLA